MEENNLRWKGKSRGGTWGNRIFICLVRHAGLRAAYTLLFFVVPYFVLFAPAATASVWQLNRQRLGCSFFRSAGRLFYTYYRFGQVLVDKIALIHGETGKFKFDFIHYPEFLKILDAGKGAILIGAHTGNWETGAPFFNEYANKINIVLYDAEYRKIKEMLEKQSLPRRYKLIPVQDNSLESILAIKAALDNREYVCFQGDRYVNGSATLQAPFLGKDARFPQGPFLLAARMQVPVVFYFAIREKGRRYKFHFYPANLEKTPDFSPARRNETEKRLLDLYRARLEEIVRSHPEQWFNFYRFWES